MDQANQVPPLQHIFVSYSRADSETVDVIVAHLKSDGFTVWIDRESIQVGEQWGKEIVEAVDKAYAFLLMLSPSAVASKYVHDEVYVAYRGPKDLVYVPVLLTPVEIAGDLLLPLARTQYIEYYRDPEATYAELVKVLHSRKPKPTSTIRGVGLILQGLNRFNFDAEKQEQLFDSIANFTETSRAELEITKPIDMSAHLVVKMPADAAYRLKTAALNSDVRLINYGIKGLQLTGDRSFVWVKAGRFAPLRPGNLGGGGFIGGLILVTVLFLAAIFLSQNSPPIEFTATASLTVTTTSIPSPTPSYTPTSTPTPSLTPTNTPTASSTPTSTSSPTPVPSPIFVSSYASHCRAGPGQAYQIFTSISDRDPVLIVGRTADGRWLRIYWEKWKFSCWVDGGTGEMMGNLAEVPVVIAPTVTPLPTNSPPPTPLPTSSPTPLPTETPTSTSIPPTCDPIFCGGI